MNIEIFDLHKQLDKLNRETITFNKKFIQFTSSLHLEIDV